jgi:HEAT repeat protein
MDRDSRSTTELLDAARAERSGGVCDARPALVGLHMRGTVEVLDCALELCRSDNPDLRVLAAEILGELGFPERTIPEECCTALLGLMKHDRDECVVTAAVFALGHLGS